MVSFGDRLALLLLCLGSGTVLAGGFSESLLAAMLAYMALGVAQLIFGIRAHGQFCKVRRELDGLPTERADPPAGTEAASTETRSFAPRMLPRNGGDFAVALSIGGVQTALLFVLPALGTAALTVLGAIGEYAFFLLLGVFLSFTVEKSRSTAMAYGFIGSSGVQSSSRGSESWRSKKSRGMNSSFAGGFGRCFPHGR